MAEPNETTPQNTPETKPQETNVTKSGAEVLLETVEKMGDTLEATNNRLDKMQEELEKAQKPQHPYGTPGNPAAAPGGIVGESPNSSRRFSLMRLATALRDNSRREYAKVEFDLSSRLEKASRLMGFTPQGGQVIPFAPDHMPTDEIKVETEKGNGMTLPGYEAELVKECREVMSVQSMPDPDELAYIAKRAGCVDLQKDLSAQIATLGGSLVGMPSQGALIDLLRPMELFSRVGAQEITLPPQGSIRFPRDAGDPTIAAYSEGQTITESNVATGELLLQAKKYAGLVDVPVELFQFATSVNVEAWLRNKFVRRIAIQTDADMINGSGGTSIQGIVNYSNIRTVIATTTGANGDTLHPDDPSRLFADIATQNARVDQGFFFALRPNMWQTITHRRADAVSASDGAGAYLFNAHFNNLDAFPMRLEGHPTHVSTQIPANRVKGSGTDLTMLLGGVGSSWIIARAGVAEIDMTNSDASKFAQGLNTLRGLVFMDAGPEHEQEFGMIDDILETT